MPRPPRRTAAMTGTRAGLAALADHRHGVDAVDRRVAALQAQRLRDAQARAVEQGQHGGVAGEDPRLARLAGPGPAAVTATAAAAESGRGRVLSTFGLRIAAKARRGAVALALEMAREGAQGRELAHERAALDPLARAAPPGRSGCRAASGPTSAGKVGASPRCTVEEGQELAQVPAIGLDGLRREPALLGERGEPALTPPRGCRRRPGGARSRGRNALDMFLLCARADRLAPRSG